MDGNGPGNFGNEKKHLCCISHTSSWLYPGTAGWLANTAALKENNKISIKVNDLGIYDINNTNDIAA